MKKLILPNNEFLTEASLLLSEGQRVIIPVKGSSMHPFIIAGRDCVELYPPLSICCGDIVLAKIGNSYILHRIIRFEKGNTVILMGDGNLYQKETCRIQDIVGIAKYSIRNDKKRYSLNNSTQQILSQLWCKQPVFSKRCLLWFFHRIHHNN